MRIFILHIILIISTLGAVLGQPGLRAKLDSTYSTVATPFTLELEANVQGGEKITLIPTAEKDSSGFFVLKSEVLENSNSGGVLNWKAKVWMIGMDAGLGEIPPIQATVSSNGQGSTLRSNPLQITLRPAVVDTTAEIQPILEPRDAPYTFREFLPYLVIILLLAGIGFLIYYLVRKKQQAEALITLPPPPPDPPFVVAFRKLKDVESKALWEKAAYKQHYSAVTDVLREYVEERLKLPALESTTDETIAALKKAKFDNTKTTELEALLQDADLVKFAKQPSTPEASKSILKQAQAWLQNVHQQLDPPTNETPTP
ncbi:MAG: hypothetical protein AB8F95_07060 [Bacteroidia bacterium]